MVKKTDSTVFNVGADCIVNTINCVGFMGKGIALEFALRYPQLEQIYIGQCKKKEIHTGCVYFYEVDGQKILNFPTKFHFKYPSKLEWIEQGLQYFVDHYKEWNIKSIAFPLLGTNNGGLDKETVETLMIKYLSLLDIDVFICYSKLLEGKEKEMVESFKKSSTDKIKKHIRLTAKQEIGIDKIRSKVERFADILNADGIGIDTYSALFTLFYSEIDVENKQLSLFN